MLPSIASIVLLLQSQIDGAAKDKHCRQFSDKFHVILFFTRPTDQSDDLVDYSQQVRLVPRVVITELVAAP